MARNVEILLQPPSKDDFPTHTRTSSSYHPLHTFELIQAGQRNYQNQFADMYFLRLVNTKPILEQITEDAWKDFEIAGERARPAERVLDVRQGELCWVVGTVFMEMSLKPNVMDDLSKEHWLSAVPPREKYATSDGSTGLYLEDESGRLRLTGQLLASTLLVTGAIIGALGTENADGVFEVIDIRLADLPRQPERWEQENGDAVLSGKKVAGKTSSRSKIAIISGLAMSGDMGESLLHDLLIEYLLGEAGGESSQADSARISRLIIAGNSFSNACPIPSREELASNKALRRHGFDASTYNPASTEHLDSFLAAILPSLPITILPGADDPANVAIPQQPLHNALFPRSRAYATPPKQEHREPGWFDSVTNPWEGDVEGWRFLGNGGQPIDDIFKYVEGYDRLEMMEHILRWRCNAPTAPDTLWSYPFQNDDPLVIKECPHVYFVGNQPRFDTTVIEGPAGQQVRLIAIPKFRETGIMVLLDLETLAVECVRFDIFDRGG